MPSRSSLAAVVVLAALLVTGCENRAEQVRLQLLGSWNVVGATTFLTSASGQRYTFEDDGTFSIQERRRLGTTGTLRAAYEIARDGSLTLRDATAARSYTTSFAGDTLYLRALDAEAQPITLVRPPTLPAP